MNEGIIENKQDKEVNDFLINSGYEPFNVIPLCCILTGSRAYGLATKESDQDYLGIHIMDTWDCLDHPDFRPRNQVIKQRFRKDLTSIPPGDKGGDISLDSFEMWKFISLYLKGSPVSYELLYLPTIHCDPNTETLFTLMRKGVTNRIGKAARGIAIHGWAKNKTNRKKAVITYYRLMQAILFLREGEFVWDIGQLLEYMDPSKIVNRGKTVIGKYTESELRKAPITEIKEVGNEIHYLIDEVDRSGVTTILPDRVPKELLETILQIVKKTRSIMI